MESIEFPKHLHSPKDNGEFVVVNDADEQIEKMAEGWLIAPPSQTKGQDAHAKAEHEKVEKAKHQKAKAKA